MHEIIFVIEKIQNTESAQLCLPYIFGRNFDRLSDSWLSSQIFSADPDPPIYNTNL